MKKLFKLSLMSIALMAYTMNLSAQAEVKIAPFSLLFAKNIKIGAEVGIKDNIGLDADILYSFDSPLSFVDEDINGHGFGVRVFGKYYFNPRKGVDGFFAGPYVRWKNLKGDNIAGTTFTSHRVAGGLFFGYKLVADSGLLFEIGLGAGRKFVNVTKDDTGTEIADSLFDLINIDFPGRIAIGYRFGGGNSESGSSGRSKNRR